MIQELYINDRLVDLPDDSVIALSFAVNTLNELKSLNGNISNRINLPKTKNNLQVLGFVGDINIDLSQTARKRNTCKYLINGVEIIASGAVEIGTINKTIGILITSGNIDFFDLVDGSLRTLNLSVHDHKFDLTAIPNSRFNREGYVYPLINYGDLTRASDKVNVRNMRPATFAFTIVNQIVNEAGFKLINDLENNIKTKDQYNNIIIPFANDRFERGQRFIDSLQPNKAAMFINTPFDFGMSRKGDVFPGALESYYFTKVVFDQKTDNSNSIIEMNTYVSKVKMTADIEINIAKLNLIWAQSPGNPFVFRIMVLPAGIADVNNYAQADSYSKFSQSFNKPDGSYPVSQVFNNLTLKASSVNINVGDRVFLEVSQLVQTGGKSDAHFLIEPLTQFIIKPVIGPVEFGDTVELEATLPDISRKDFIKFVANLFGAIVQTDNSSKTVRFVPFSILNDNITKAKDWSNKVVDLPDESNDIKIGDYAISNLALYDNDDEIIPEGYAGSKINIADENLKSSEELFRLPFSASYDDRIFNNINAVLIKKINQTSGTEFEINTGPRLAMVRFESGVFELKYNDGSFTLGVTDSVPYTYFASINGLPGLMLDDALGRYYKELTSVLNDQRKKTVPLILTDVDIVELDFFIPVYIGMFSSYFYISKITNYVSGRACTAQLIKLL